MLREVVIIDEQKCDGCGLCVPACQEGALRIVDGKARLVSDRLCDGLGACLGHCPRGAITIERRESKAFDEAAVAAHKRAMADMVEKTSATPGEEAHPAACPGSRLRHLGGCPGSRVEQFGPGTPTSQCCTAGVAHQASALTHWPVQLHLLPPTAPLLRGARLLICADCVPVAYANFHAELLRNRAVVIACPKLDDTTGYVEKLTAMIRENDLKEITVAYMEVPCCTGIVHMVLQARRLAGSDLPVKTVLIGVRGELKKQEEIPAD